MVASDRLRKMERHPFIGSVLELSIRLSTSIRVGLISGNCVDLKCRAQNLV